MFFSSTPMPSMPRDIHPAFSLPPNKPSDSCLEVGSSVKDMENGSNTPMKLANDRAVAVAHRTFEANTAQYEADLSAATIKAESSKAQINEARKKQIIAITCLAIATIAAVAIVIAAAVTQTWPILFIAIPFLSGIVPASIFTHIYSKDVKTLENDIAAPGKMRRPVLNLPVYNPGDDLDLKQTRINLQNSLGHKKLKDLADEDISNKTIINYALLDRVTNISPEKRPAFYARTIQLINAYGETVKEHNRLSGIANREFNDYTRSLHKWKYDQDAHLSRQESNLLEQERYQIQTNEARRRGEPAPERTFGNFTNFFTRLDLENQRKSVEQTYGRSEVEIKHWYKTNMQGINATYAQAIANLEMQYSEAKTAASAAV